jgi:hypothetical protein
MKAVTAVYSLNETPLYWKMLVESVRSLRRFSPHLKVIVFSFGPPPLTYANSLRRMNVQILKEPKRPLSDGFILKWLTIHKVKSDTVAVLDVDTIFYEPLENLIRKYSVCDFYARHEIGMGKAEKIGAISVKNRLLNSGFKRYAKEIKARQVPIFNAGFSIWNWNANQKWKDVIFQFLKTVHHIQTQQSPKLVKSTFFADEIAASLCLGKLKNFKIGNVSKRDFPFFMESLAQRFQPTGILHVNTSHYLEWLKYNSTSDLEIKKWSKEIAKARRQTISFSQRVDQKS